MSTKADHGHLRRWLNSHRSMPPIKHPRSPYTLYGEDARAFVECALDDLHYPYRDEIIATALEAIAR